MTGEDLAGEDIAAQLERHRVGLTGYCYRMLGSAAEADDAVQETMVRAWRHAGRFEGRSSLRSWLYRIATNVCLVASDGRRRRALPVDMGPAAEGTPSPLGRWPEATWIEPVPDHRVLPGARGRAAGAIGAVGADPAEQVVARESIRLAFVAALQYLPPRQRAVLILREVLRWPAAEVAELLGATVVSVNSALQRARAGLAQGGAGVDGVDGVDGGVGRALRPDPAELDDRHRALLARYVDAFERFDVDEIVALLHEDAVSQMPPMTLWFRGREALRAAMVAGDDQPCRGSKLVPVAANGSPAYAHYRPNRPGDPGPAGGFHAWAVQVVEASDGCITAITSFVDAPHLFPRFGLPNRLAPGEEPPTTERT
jgi:RNA polymerase sigma-70 factor (ECF subfamily)